MEYRIIMALADVKAVTFECSKADCSARVSVSPDKVRVPEKCPSCPESWMSGAQTSQQSETSQATNFVAALAHLRVLEGQALSASNPLPFRILLEFAEDRRLGS